MEHPAFRENALRLLALYSEAWQISGDDQFKRTSEETAGWVLREMRAPEGGFYSSLDADSEGEEGRYYIWTPASIEDALKDDAETERLLPLVMRHYGLDRPANFEGHWHLRVTRPLSEVADELGLDAAKARALLDRARQKLFAVREQRVRPGRDDKLLTSWNALMIRGLATAGRVFERDDWIDAAATALDCLREHLWVNGRLLATYKDGHAHLNAYLDDYAFLLDAILTLLQARWRRADLDFAAELAEVLLEHYADEQHGGFFFTADDHEQLIQRSKPLMDDSLPNGNGIAAFALQRLGHLLGEPRYLDAAHRTLLAAWPDIERLPFAHDALLLALEENLYPPQMIILRGDAEQLPKWQAITQQGYQPRRLTLAIPAAETELPGALATMQPQEPAVAYVCSGTQCSAPIDDAEMLRRHLHDA